MRYRDELDGSWRGLCPVCAKIIYRPLIYSPWADMCPVGHETSEIDAPVSVVIGSRGQPLLLPVKPALSEEGGANG